MTDKEFADVIAMSEGYCKILAVLIPKVRQGTATPAELEAYGQAVSGLAGYRDQMAKGIAETWGRYDIMVALVARLPGSGPALVPVLNDLRDLARFKILDEPASRPLWQPRLQQIEWHLSQWGR